MITEEEIIREFILTGKETECVDFKEKIYSAWKDSDFIKDIAAFANGEATGDKYIIFGLTDKEHTVVGVETSEIPDPSALENLISEKIEPRLNIQCGSIEADGKTIFYVKVPSGNNNPPYVIRSDSSRAKQGDIFIRVGTCNRKANRSDIDAMNKRNLHASIRFFNDSVLICPIRMPDELIKEPTYGMVDVELINPTKQPILICDGYISFENEFGRITRRICRINPQYPLGDNPYSIAANNRENKKLLFDFASIDCIQLRFENSGILHYETKIQVVLIDTDNQKYETEIIPGFITAKGDVLWKVQGLYKEWRKWLSKNKATVLSYINSDNEELLISQLNKMPCDFSFLQPGYVIQNDEYPEYETAYLFVKAALEKSEKMIAVLKKYGMSESYISFVTKSEKT